MKCVAIAIAVSLMFSIGLLRAETRFEECKGLWDAVGLSDYEFIITQTRSIEKEARLQMDGTFRVTVRDGTVTEVQSVHRTDTGVVPIPDLPGTIDDIYRIVSEAREDKGVTVEFQCHMNGNYPGFVHIRGRGRWPVDSVGWSLLVVIEPEPVGMGDAEADQ